ncbi:hypothetical protein IQ255_02395 [Pleurocapsales cyanobacterium LEGE 10410]|nr:hypothetical protein [Pleurocapsales cyanobacterium LEGE 10410]
MLLFVILVVLLFGNWFFTETLVFIPVNLITRLASIGWWGLGLVTILFLAWCIGED